MSEVIQVRGFDGATPLGFMAALGLLNVITRQDPYVNERAPTLEWYRDGPRIATLTCGLDFAGVVQAVISDRDAPSMKRILRLSYPKIENDGRAGGKVAKQFLGLRPPVGILRAWLTQCIQAGDWEAITVLASLTTETATEPIKPESRPRPDQIGELAVDTTRRDALNSSTAPTFFDFTSKNQQFLDQLRLISASFEATEVESELTGAARGVAVERTMGWDLREDRPGALFPAGGGLRFPVLEWLAFRALPLFPMAGAGETALTTSCKGRRKRGLFRWCLWDAPVTLSTFQAVSRTMFLATGSAASRRALGIVEVFESELAKGADGYSGVFQPVSVV